MGAHGNRVSPRWRRPPAGHDARRRRVSSAASCFTSCRAGSTAFVTTACSPVRRARSTARARELLVVAPPPDDDVPEEPLDVRPRGGGHMIIIETFEPWHQPRAPPHSTPPTGRKFAVTPHGPPQFTAT
jgi:hypothetical protein